MNPFRLRSKWTEKPPGGGEGGGEYESPGGDVIPGQFPQYGESYPYNWQGTRPPDDWTGESVYGVPDNPEIITGPTGRLVPPREAPAVPDLPESPLASNVIDFPNSPDFSDYWLNRAMSGMPENLTPQDLEGIQSVDDFMDLRAPGHEAFNTSDYQDLVGKGYEPNIETLDPNNLAANEPTGPDAAVYDMPGAGPPDDAISMPPEPMPWDANLGQKFPEGWDPLAKYLHDPAPSKPAPPDWLGGALGAAPWAIVGAQILGQWIDQGNAKHQRWAQDAAMDSGLPGAETPTDLAPNTDSSSPEPPQQFGTADSGTDIYDPLSGQNAGMQELLADEEQRGVSGPPTEGPPYDSTDVTGVYDPVSGGVIDTTGGGSSDTPPQPLGDSGVTHNIDPMQPPTDQNQYDPFAYDGGGGGGNGGGYQGAETNTGISSGPGYSGPPDVGYRVGFVPNTGVNTGVNGEGGSGGGSGGGGGGVGGFPGDGGGGDMGDGSDTVADWLDWLFGGGGGSPHTGTSDPFRIESEN